MTTAFSSATNRGPALVTGATGYVGGRLVPRLIAEGHSVRAMGRSIEKMACRPWASHPAVELAQGDAMDLDSLTRAMAGCRAAYYLIHSMNAHKDKFAHADRVSAQNMARAAAAAGAGQIIYLSGLGDKNNENMSPHLRSRHEVEDILAEGPVPVTTLRAAMILGSGSASFEILRYLTERLPVMVTPKWVRTPCQPIAIRDVLNYLAGCLDDERALGRTLDIGGADVLTYTDIINIYAEEAGLARRRIIQVPLLTPRLSAQWIHMITPVPASIAVPLTEGMGVPVTCQNSDIQQIVPAPPLSCREAIRLALDRVSQEMVETCWSDAGAIATPEWAACGDAEYAGGTILECGYRARVSAPPEAAWKPVARIGGKTGYYAGDYLWWLRGAVDRMAGGYGLRRGRRHPSKLAVGEALDFWRVMVIEPPERLVLLAEMRMPGEALLEIRVEPAAEGAEIILRSRFLPRGLAGLAYWYVLYPFHQWIFSGMLMEMARRAGGRMIVGPERTTPKLPDTCRLGPGRRIF